MSLQCFFGAELRADGPPVTPAAPAGSALVVTHCALTAAAGPAVTLYAQSHGQPARFALCTLAPARDTFHCALQLVFSQRVTFTLVAEKGAEAARCPAVHLTGFFETDPEREEALRGEKGEEDEWEESEEDAEEVQMMTGSRKRGRAAKVNGKKSQAKEDVKESKKKRKGKTGG